MRESRTYGSVRGQCREALVYSTVPLYYSPVSRFHMPMGVLLCLNSNCPYSYHATKDSDLPKR